MAAVRALLAGGANANAATMSGGATPLHLAAANGNPEVVNALLTHGAVVDARDGAWEQTPLMWAAAANRVKVVEVLLKAGASVKAMSKVEDTPARERADRTSLQLRSRRVAALKAAEQPLRPRTRHVDEALQCHAAGVHVIEHHRHQRLHARHARMTVGIGVVLFFARVRRVV